MEPKPLHVMFVVTGLERGGAEIMLSALLRAIDRRVVSPRVVCLKDRGSLGAEIESAGIPVHTLEIGSGRGVIVGFLGLLRLIDAHRPDVLQGWLPHANLAVTLAGLLRRRRTSWGVRNSALPDGTERRSTLWCVRLLAHLSRFVAKIVYNSEAGRIYHESIGYNAGKASVIFNGFDLQRFVASNERRVRFRATHGIDPDVPVIGLIGRYHPLKDHATFLKAAEMIGRSHSQSVFLLAGRGCAPGNATLEGVIHALGLTDRVRLLGELTDPGEMFPALDVLVSSSISEGFPTAVGEAMSCAIPCVVTDVGDSRFLVGDSGVVVPVRDPAALAAGCRRLLDMQPNQKANLGEAARSRMAQLFSLERSTERYQNLYREIAAT